MALAMVGVDLVAVPVAEAAPKLKPARDLPALESTPGAKVEPEVPQGD